VHTQQRLSQATEKASFLYISTWSTRPTIQAQAHVFDKKKAQAQRFMRTYCVNRVSALAIVTQFSHPNFTQQDDKFWGNQTLYNVTFDKPRVVPRAVYLHYKH